MTIHTYVTYCRLQEQRIRRWLEQFGRKARSSQTANTALYSRRRPQEFDDYLTQIQQNRPTTRGLAETAPRPRRRRA